jgi:hypothetical protein
MKIAYLICAHKNPDQLKRLIGALQSANVLFFVHIDAKSDETIFREALKNTTAIFSKKRARVNWGGFSQVDAWMTLLEEAQAHHPDYFINLSGQDYPLQSPEKIAHFFATAKDKNFIEYFSLPHASWAGGGMQRLNGYYYQDVESTLLRRIFARLGDFRAQRFFPKNFAPVAGGAWFALTAKTVSDLFTQRASWQVVETHLRRSLGPDEIFFQTVLSAYVAPQDLISDHLRAIRWQESAANPDIYTEKDFEQLCVSGKLFARKFDVAIDANILDRIDRELLL